MRLSQIKARFRRRNGARPEGVELTLDLSTGHVSGEDAKKLDAMKGNGGGGRNTGLPRIIDTFYGWIIPLGYFGECDEDGSNMARLEAELPSVADCAKLAMRYGCSMLHFDGDADQVSSLPLYEW